MPSIKKPSIIITSGGRTGTRFFTRLFNTILDSRVCLHEPENINWKDFHNFPRVLKNFGAYNATIKKLMGKWGITAISNQRIMGRITVDQAASLLLQQRKKFVESFPQNVYVECSYHYYGLLDVLPRAFDTHRAAYIARDGRHWVRSHMNMGQWYSPYNPHTLLGNRIRPAKEQKEYHQKWHSMSRFEKLCWAWAKINAHALETIGKNPCARLFYFEELFQSEKKYQKLTELVDFTAKSLGQKVHRHKIRGMLKKKINKPPTYDFPPWNQWTLRQKKDFKKICGPMMKTLGYECKSHEMK